MPVEDAKTTNPSVLRWGALLIGVLIFVFDWSGFDKWEPDLFFPKPFREIWWHLPIEIGIALAIARFIEWADRGGDRGTIGWREPSRTRQRLRNAFLVGSLGLVIGDLVLAPWLGWRVIGQIDCFAALLMIGAVILD